jgi:hypothetical protein
MNFVKSVPFEVKVEVNLRPTVSRPICLGVRRPSGTRDQFFFLLEISFRHLKLKLIYDRQSVSQSVLLSGAHLRPTTNFSFSSKISFRQLRVSQSQSHVMADNQSASPSWCQAPIWDPRPIFLSP